MAKRKQRVSDRKITANRQNALKSTGPRTQRGKLFSSKNAITHGLFVMGTFMFDGANRENHAQYQELLDGLAETYQPVGVAEQLQVQRMAACYWRLGRAWRYENAEIFLGHSDCVYRQQMRIKQTRLSSQDQARLTLLRNAQEEAENTGTISAELREKMFGADPEFRKEWKSLEEGIKERHTELLVRLNFSRSDAEQYGQEQRCVLFLTSLFAIYMIEHRTELLAQRVLPTALDRAAIPRTEALDRLLRADAAAERALNHAIERLERLQQRRLDEGGSSSGQRSLDAMREEFSEKS